jgi:hypothetical protein
MATKILPSPSGISSTSIAAYKTANNLSFKIPLSKIVIRRLGVRVFDDKAASKALSNWGRSMSNAANQINAANGNDSESSLVVFLKAMFWQWYVWRFLKANLRTEIALLLLPIGVFTIFAASALVLGVFGQNIGSEGLTFFPFYLLTTLFFWVTTVAVGLVIALATYSIRTVRRLIWWIKRG